VAEHRWTKKLGPNSEGGVCNRKILEKRNQKRKKKQKKPHTKKKKKKKKEKKKVKDVK